MRHLLISKIIGTLCVLLCINLGLVAQNAKPFVVPELKEWKGKAGAFVPGEQLRIVYDNQALRQVAEAFAADYATVVRRIGRQLMAGITLQEKQAIRSAMEKIRRNIAAADITLSHPGHTEETP